MDRLVIDASVLATFFTGEEGADDVEIILETISEIYAPSFWRFELANVIWKKKEISEKKGEELIERIWRFPINDETSVKVAKNAFLISKKYNITFYDSSYIAMAAHFNIPLWTLDKSQAKVAVNKGISLWESRSS